MGKPSSATRPVWLFLVYSAAIATVHARRFVRSISSKAMGTTYDGDLSRIARGCSRVLSATKQPGIAFNKHFEIEGSVLFHHACKLGCEGIVSKRVGSPYQFGRSNDWS